MSGKVYKKGNTFYVDPQYNERYYGPIKINNNLEWIGRDGTSTYMRPVEYMPSEEAYHFFFYIFIRKRSI